jgi:DNA-binding HxlR family transcriptional regulator
LSLLPRYDQVVKNALFCNLIGKRILRERMNRKTISCPVETTLTVIGGRWKVLVLHELFSGIKRFSELHRALVGVSHRTLAQQLRELAANGLVRRKVYREVPPKVEYSLTPLGESLKPILDAMHEWGEEYPRGKGSRRR